MKQFFLDVDGVILNYEAGLIDWFIKNYEPKFTPPKDTFWESSPVVKKYDINKLDSEFLKSPALGQLSPLISLEDYKILTDKYPVYLITNIPEESIIMRERNFHQLGKTYKAIYSAGLVKYHPDYPTKSEKILELSKPNTEIIFLDDLSDNCAEVKKNIPHAKVFLMEGKRNLGVADSNLWFRTKNWTEFLKLNQVI